MLRKDANTGQAGGKVRPGRDRRTVCLRRPRAQPVSHRANTKGGRQAVTEGDVSTDQMRRPPRGSRTIRVLGTGPRGAGAPTQGCPGGVPSSRPTGGQLGGTS